MIVCLCEAVSDRTVRERIAQGDRTVGQLRRSCGAGGSCGSCVCDLKQLIREARAQQAAPQPLPLAAK